MKASALLLSSLITFAAGTSISRPGTPPKPKSPYGVSLHATIQIAPQNVTRFIEYAKDIVATVIQEPLCHFFELYLSAEEPGVISWVENWDATLEWLVDVQLPKEYYKEYLEATEPMYIGPREMTFHNVAGPPFAFYKSWNKK
ncbi:hypothetical protein QBC35DRAFT_502123 [Podospora australis]|uniref:ABM domain-containing protein n=1 Tax=Podospora australis TaxID=1536484 RepID=A0AAN7AHH1_9PEZI|nr:hypothetical protein QBC35DRAFT_502123 [Podospora australis]